MIMRIRRCYVPVALAFAIPVLFAQEAPAPQLTSAKAAETKSSEATQPKEETSTTDHVIRLGTQTIAYNATASTTLLKNDKDEPVASIFSVAYTRSDVKDMSQRPVIFLYNGGPGVSSAWLHMVRSDRAASSLRTLHPPGRVPTSSLIMQAVCSTKPI